MRYFDVESGRELRGENEPPSPRPCPACSAAERNLAFEEAARIVVQHAELMFRSGPRLKLYEAAKAITAKRVEPLAPHAEGCPNQVRP